MMTGSFVLFCDSNACARCGAWNGKRWRRSGIGSCFASSASRGGDKATFGQRVDHAVARGLCDGRETVGPAAFGRLRQRDQQRRFAHGQTLRFLAEPGEACGAHAFEVAAIGGERQVALEDFIFRQVPFELQRAGDLQHLGAERALARLHQARDLHADRRGAGDDARLRPRVGRRRAASPTDRRPGDRGSGGLPRRAASSDSARRLARACTGRRQRPSCDVKARSSAPSAAVTMTERSSARVPVSGFSRSATPAANARPTKANAAMIAGRA